MTQLKKHLATAALGAAVAAGALAASTTAANAYVVCNRYHECWRVREHYVYPATAGVVVYGDSWRFPSAAYHWRAYPGGRGYYYHGVWRRY
jgi:hypothetical protein